MLLRRAICETFITFVDNFEYNGIWSKFIMSSNTWMVFYRTAHQPTARTELSSATENLLQPCSNLLVAKYIQMCRVEGQRPMDSESDERYLATVWKKMDARAEATGTRATLLLRALWCLRTIVEQYIFFRCELTFPLLNAIKMRILFVGFSIDQQRRPVFHIMQMIVCIHNMDDDIAVSCRR